MKKEVCFPVTFMSEEVLRSIATVKKLLALKLNELRDFTKENKMRRQPVALDRPLPEMPILRGDNRSFDQLISYIINFHLQLSNNSKQTLVMVPESDQIVVYFHEGTLEKTIDDLTLLQKTWVNEIFPRLSKWKFISGTTKIYFECLSYPYFKNILSICTNKNADTVLEHYGIEMIPSAEHSGQFLYQTDIKAQSDKPLNIEKDLSKVQELLTNTKIRIDYRDAFINDVSLYCYSVLKHGTPDNELLKYIAIITSHIQAYDKNRDAKLAFTKIMGIYELAIKINPSIANSNGFGVLGTYGSMYSIAETLNAYADKNEIFETTAEGVEVVAIDTKDLIADPGIITMTINFELLSTIEKELDTLLKKLTHKTVTLEKIKSITPEIKAISEFYKSKEITEAAKVDLSKFLYLKFLKDLQALLGNYLKTISDDSLHPYDDLIDDIYHTSYQITKATTKFLPKKSEKNDCIYFEFTTLQFLLQYYKKTKTWNFVEDCLIHIAILGNRTQAVAGEISTLTFEAYSLRISTYIVRDSLTQAICCYHEFCKFFIARLKEFVKHSPAQLITKINNIQIVYEEIHDLCEQAKTLASCISENGMHQLALQIIESANQQLNTMLSQVADFLSKIKAVFRSKEEIDRVFTTLQNSLNEKLRCFEQKHLLSLIECGQRVKDHESYFIITNTTNPPSLTICPKEANDIALFQKAFKKFQISVVLSENKLTLNKPSKVKISDFSRALCNVILLKNAQNAKNQLPPVIGDVKPEPVIEVPDYEYFLNLDSGVVTQKVAKSSNQKKSGGKKSVVIAPPAPPLCVNFGELFGIYNEATKTEQRIVALQDNYRGFGIFFGRIDPALPPAVQQRFRKALANRGPNKGTIVAGKGNEGVKFFKKAGTKAWKIKIPGQDEFLEGHEAMNLLERDQNGMPIRRFLLNFDEVKNHAQEQREMKHK